MDHSNQSPVLSVILPIYNVEKYLARCVDSILNQTFQNLEVILVDDGSPDGCPQICDEYAQKDSRVIVIHLENGGVSRARNAGIHAARGKLIGFVDPDDFVAPQMYEEMIGAMDDPEVDLVICGYDYVNETGEIIRPYCMRDNQILSQHDLMSMEFDMPPTIRHGVVNKLYRNSAFKGINFPEGLASSEDVYVNSEYVKTVQKTVFIHRGLYKNTVREGSATHGGLKIHALADSFAAHEKMHLEAISRYPDLMNHSLAFLLDVCTLKYTEAKRKAVQMQVLEDEQIKTYLRNMRRFIKRYAVHSLWNREIFWKTRIQYLLLR